MASEKTLLDQWRSVAYDEKADKQKLQQLWIAYFQKEKEIYEQLLKNPDEEVKGTVKELSEKYGVDIMTMTGFLDGINESLKAANPIETMNEDTEVSLAFDKELLYKNMVAAEADWLYNLEGWNDIFTEEKKKELYKEQKSSTTVVRRQRYIQTIHVHVEVVRSTRNAAVKMLNNVFDKKKTWMYNIVISYDIKILCKYVEEKSKIL